MLDKLHPPKTIEIPSGVSVGIKPGRYNWYTLMSSGVLNFKASRKYPKNSHGIESQRDVFTPP